MAQLGSAFALFLGAGHSEFFFVFRRFLFELFDFLLDVLAAFQSRRDFKDIVHFSYRLPTLERAWCDSAYWMRKSLFDTIDTRAVTKLETALEVLICTESSKNSKPRVTSALQNLLGVKPDERILPPFEITTQVLVDTLVRDRSRIMHGTWSTLGNRVPTRRDGVEAVVGAVLRQAAIHLQAYSNEASSVDTIEAFFNWLEQEARGVIRSDLNSRIVRKRPSVPGAKHGRSEGSHDKARQLVHLAGTTRNH